jgi:deoxyribodipyrimidine photo-lyase
LNEYEVSGIYTNHDYEPYAHERDEAVREYANSEGADFHTFKDQVIFEKDEVLSGAGTPYTVFTPYSRKWKEKVNEFYLKSYPTEDYFENFLKTEAIKIPTLKEMGFEAVGKSFPKKEIRESIVKDYAEKRDFPSIEGTTRLSVHLRFGTVSIRELARKAQKLSETWLNELIWRDFYFNILHHFPHVGEGHAFRKQYDLIEWRNNEVEFQKWCEGKTGYPIVDAGMRQLNETGFMHNRVRMITASFMIKHLLIDWRWGEAYFAKKLIDFDFSANNGGWQWAAGSGCDAAPYFRVFNPTLQTQKFDKNLEYIKKWVPELNSFDYPQPIVVHEFARKRVLEVYQKALKGEG